MEGSGFTVEALLDGVGVELRDDAGESRNGSWGVCSFSVSRATNDKLQLQALLRQRITYLHPVEILR